MVAPFSIQFVSLEYPSYLPLCFHPPPNRKNIDGQAVWTWAKPANELHHHQGPTNARTCTPAAGIFVQIPNINHACGPRQLWFRFKSKGHVPPSVFGAPKKETICTTVFLFRIATNTMPTVQIN